jgi:hypothetical protein
VRHQHNVDATEPLPRSLQKALMLRHLGKIRGCDIYRARSTRSEVGCHCLEFISRTPNQKKPGTPTGIYPPDLGCDR